jgi:hypothetical protein
MNKNFVRLKELASLHRKDKSSYFNEDNDRRRQANEQFEEFLLSYEKELSELDDESWSILKRESESLCVQFDEDRGWTKLFEKLNEAKGYCFLKSKGYSKIGFITPSKEGGVETPDLKGERNTSIALCEVKTKNISDDLIESIDKAAVIRSQENLSDGLKKNLKSTFKKARDQLNSYAKFSNPVKYIYLVINYDGNPFVDRKKMDMQTRELFQAMKLIDINLVIHGEEE